jgi:hypothetical protein
LVAFAVDPGPPEGSSNIRQNTSPGWVVWLPASGKGNHQMIKNSTFCTKFFANFHFFVSFCRAHAGTLQNHSISPCANTVLNNTVELSTICSFNKKLNKFCLFPPIHYLNETLSDTNSCEPQIKLSWFLGENKEQDIQIGSGHST